MADQGKAGAAVAALQGSDPFTSASDRGVAVGDQIGSMVGKLNMSDTVPHSSPNPSEPGSRIGSAVGTTMGNLAPGKPGRGRAIPDQYLNKK